MLLSSERKWLSDRMKYRAARLRAIVSESSKILLPNQKSINLFFYLNSKIVMNKKNENVQNANIYKRTCAEPHTINSVLFLSGFVFDIVVVFMFIYFFALNINHIHRLRLGSLEWGDICSVSCCFDSFINSIRSPPSSDADQTMSPLHCTMWPVPLTTASMNRPEIHIDHSRLSISIVIIIIYYFRALVLI